MYQKFKETLESMSKVGAKEYNELIKKYGTQNVNKLFDKYINDLDIKDDIKISHTFYYLEQLNQEENDKNKEEIADNYTCDYISDDLLMIYLKEIGEIPLLTVEEEKNLGEKLRKYRNKLTEAKITDRKIDLDLIKFGYVKIDKTLPREECIKSIEKAIKTIPKDTKSRKKQKKWAESLTTANTQELVQKLDTLIKYKEVFDEFQRRNLKLVVSRAKNFKNIGEFSFLDLIQEGNIGLGIAINKFDITKGFKLSTYASYWIDQTISRAIADKSKTIRVPVHQLERLKKLKKAKTILTQELGGLEPTKEELASALGTTVAKIEELLSIQQDTVSLDKPVSEGNANDSESFLKDIIPTEGATAEDLFIQEQLKEKLSEVLHEINVKEAFVLALRNGLSLAQYFNLDDLIIVAFESFKKPNTLKNNDCLKELQNIADKKQKALSIALSCNLNNMYLYFKKSDIEENIADLKIIKLPKEVQIEYNLTFLNFLEAYQHSMQFVGALTLEETGKIMGVTRERIRQVERNAARKVRVKSYYNGLGSFLD